MNFRNIFNVFGMCAIYIHVSSFEKSNGHYTDGYLLYTCFIIFLFNVLRLFKVGCIIISRVIIIDITNGIQNRNSEHVFHDFV